MTAPLIRRRTVYVRLGIELRCTIYVRLGLEWRRTVYVRLGLEFMRTITTNAPNSIEVTC